MKNDFCMMIPNDHSFVEDNDVWFVGRSGNDLCKGNLLSENCQYITTIPSIKGRQRWRLNPLCIKYSEYVVCLPDIGECIWVYDLQKEKFTKIEIENPSLVRLGFYCCWVIEKKLWAWSDGLKSIIEIDLENMQIENYYTVTGNKNESFARQAIAVENNIYVFSSERKILYEFNIIYKKIKEYEIPQIGDGIFSICYDGEFFWFTGLDECIYMWNSKTGYTKELTDFPRDFKVDRSGSFPLFYDSICTETYICFIPFNVPGTICNSVLLVSRRNYEMKVIRLYNDNRFDGGYVLEYIREGRYIGIHYSYNDFISEIDLTNFEIQEKHMRFAFEDYMVLFKHHSLHNIYYEEHIHDLTAFINL